MLTLEIDATQDAAAWWVTISGHDPSGPPVTVEWGDDTEAWTLSADEMAQPRPRVQHRFEITLPAVADTLDDVADGWDTLRELAAQVPTMARLAGEPQPRPGSYLISATQGEQYTDGVLEVVAPSPLVLQVQPQPGASDPNTYQYVVAGGPPNTSGYVDPGDGSGQHLTFTTDRLGTATAGPYTYSRHVGSGVTHYTPTAVVGPLTTASDVPVDVEDLDPFTLTYQVVNANTGTFTFTVHGVYGVDSVQVWPDATGADTLTVLIDPETASGTSDAYRFRRSGSYVATAQLGDQAADTTPFTVRLPITGTPEWETLRGRGADTYLWRIDSGADPFVPTYVLPYGDGTTRQVPVRWDASGKGLTGEFTYTQTGVFSPVLVCGEYRWTAASPVVVGQNLGGDASGSLSSGGVTPWGTPFGPSTPTTSWKLQRSVWLNGMPTQVDDAAGVGWMLTGLTGWRGSPQSTIELTQRTSAHGAWADPKPFLQPRQLEAKMTVFAPTAAQMRDAVESLILACPLEPFPLVVDESGLRRMCWVQRNGDVLVDDSADTDVYSTMSIPMVAADPRRYAEEEQRIAVRLPFLTGGLRLPTTTPFTISAIASSGVARVQHHGTTSAPWRIVIEGPTDGPVSFGLTEADGTVHRMRFTQTLPASRHVVINSADRTVLLDGYTSRRLALTGTWWEVPPGESHVWFASDSGLDSGARMTLYVRDAWM